MNLSVRWLWIAALVLAACSPAATVSPTAVSTAEPTESPAASAMPTDVLPTATVAPALSFEPATYTDSEAGFAFEYPASWTAEAPAGGGSRGSYAQFTSWAHPPGGITEIPAGGTVLQATVQLWDPKNDLQAFLAQRQGAWSASGITIVSQEELALPDGRPAARFVVQGSDGEQSYFFFTTLTDAYLVLSGNGDIALLAEIAGTLRMLPASDY
ncbi:MAG TPA: hypothetical protein VLD63_15445 [Anaerolineales bacterium]|nr:hypothetical protein [Anaerolineales bacterium]